MAGEAGSGGGELGALMPKEPNAPENSWMALLKSPFVQGAAQALASGNMSGGNTLREVLGSTPYGSQSEQLTEQNQYARKQAEQERSDKLSEGAANRASHEKVANIQSEGRITAKQIGADASMYRADLLFNKAPADQKAKFLALAEKSVAATLGNISLDDRTRTELVVKKAAEYYQAQQEMGGVKPGAASTSAPPSAGTASPAPSGGSAQTDTQTNGTPTPTIDNLLKSNNPMASQFRQDLSSAEGRKKILDDPKVNNRIKDEIKAKFGFGPPDPGPSARGFNLFGN